MRDLAYASILLNDADELPGEFLMFSAGANPSSKGTFTFDERGANDVMGSYLRGNRELMIDLEHLSLDSKSPNYDPDARGWTQLELRDGGLWATNVRWTEDGQRRLRARTQRYISPAFQAKRGRISSILNMAITALPALHHAQSLIAANRSVDPMDPEVLTALGLTADATTDHVLSAIRGLRLNDPDEDSRIASAARELTGKVHAAEVNAAIKGLCATGKAYTELSSNYAKLYADIQGREVHELIQANRAKFPPSMEEWALNQAPDTIRAYLKTMPEIVPVPHAWKEPQVQPWETLSADELEVCRVLNKDPEALKKFKQDNHEKLARMGLL